MESDDHGLSDNWLRHIKDVGCFNADKLEGLAPKEKMDKLCELNVIEQVSNVCNSSIVQKAWNNGADLTVHGWIYGIDNGILKDLDSCISSVEQLKSRNHKSHVLQVD